MSDKDDKVRVDKWLWAARFFKTRGMATDAIQGGHVHLNGNRVKPARNISVGDELRIRKGELEFIIIVEGISAKRGPASTAQQLYRETEESVARREMRAEQRRLAASQGPAPQKRPDKRSRRQIIRFTRRNNG